MSSGILIKDNQGVVQFDSRRPRLQVAVDRDPKHLDIKTMEPGTALTSSAGNGYYAEETLLSIKHNLLYTPKVLVYFYIGSNGRYGVGKYFYALGSLDDYVGYRVNESNLDIVHILDDTGLNIGYTSTAPSFDFIRVKYLIFSNPINTYTNVKLLSETLAD